MSAPLSLDLYEGQKVYLDSNGYALVWRNGQNRKVHVIEWEAHHGPRAIGFHIHHKDQNKANWQINNLEMLSSSDHRRTHAGWIRENGEWTKKPCTACGKVLPLSAFYTRNDLRPYARCKPCQCDATDLWAAQNPGARQTSSRSYNEKRKQSIAQRKVTERRVLLSSLSHDELITEVSARLNKGSFGYHGLLSTNQADHLEMWVEMFTWISAQILAQPDNTTIWAVRAEYLRITDEHTPKGVFSCNSTFYGRPAGEDHAPRPYVAEAAE